MPKNSDKSKNLALSPKLKKALTFFNRAEAEEHLKSREAQHGPLSIAERKEAANTDSPLLALPGELRNEIWKFAAPRGNGYADIFKGFAALYRFAGLLRCCRMIGDEVQMFVDKVRAELLTRTELVLTARPAGESNEYLRGIFCRLDTLKDRDVAEIKTMRLWSGTNAEAATQRLPTCVFSEGSWFCQWEPPMPLLPQSNRLIVFAKERRSDLDSSGWLPAARNYKLIKGRTLSSMGINCKLQALMLHHRESEKRIEHLVTAARSQRMSKEDIKFMLAYQCYYRVRVS